MAVLENTTISCVLVMRGVNELPPIVEGGFGMVADNPEESRGMAEVV